MKYEIIIVSPHIDDAFFSLGGLLLNNKSKRQKVVDVFGSSDYTISGRGNVGQTTSVRRREELKNAKEVGAEIEFLKFTEKGSRNPTHELGVKIKNALRKYLKQGRRVFFPLGIGGHGHHVLIARIGFDFALKEEHENIRFYEDLPYAIKGTAVFRLSGAKSSDVFPVINPKLHANALSPEYIGFSYSDKERLCRNYKSQLDWRMMASLKAYSMLVGRGLGARERIWKVSNPVYLKRLLYNKI